MYAIRSYYAEEPVEEVLVLEARHVLERPEPGFLEDFFGILPAFGHLEDEGVERPLVFFDQRLERVGIAGQIGVDAFDRITSYNVCYTKLLRCHVYPLPSINCEQIPAVPSERDGRYRT